MLSLDNIVAAIIGSAAFLAPEQDKMVLLPLKKQFESGDLHALSIETRVN